MNSRELNKTESYRLQSLAEAGLECALLYLTATGLKKSILDATDPVRNLLKDAGIHNYSEQAQGEVHKVKLKAFFFHTDAVHTIPVSLYRPQTKQGDPRLWLYGLKSFAQPQDVLALFGHQQQLHCVNLSETEMVNFMPEETALDRFLVTLKAQYNSVANELLMALKAIAAKGPIEAVGSHDTAIGRTIEAALGIAMNPNQTPDYKGIELKSKRSRSKTTRYGLFAQVPDWTLSHYKNFRTILKQFGYQRENRLQLYCTVSAKQPNSQGLMLDLREDLAQLHEIVKHHESISPVCVWRLSTLHERLHSKHKETFWIQAEQIQLGGQTYFELKNVHHTRKPSAFQFNRLLDSGEISVDHMIKIKEHGAHERGPQFKINRASLNELFLGASKDYCLQK